MTYRTYLVISFLFLITSSLAQPQQPRTTRIHEPKEIMDIMQKSAVSYVIEELQSRPEPQKELKTVPVPPPFVDTSDGTRKLSQYAASEDVARLLEKAQTELADNPGQLRTIYLQTYGLDPAFSYLLTLVGETYFQQKRYDSAIIWFQRSIDSNFLDFNAHWWLGDSYWQVGKKDRALEELSLAHILNPHHQEIFASLKARRSDAGQPWRNRNYDPVYEISQDDSDRVHIKSTPEWVGYALVKALWQFEPGYDAIMLDGRPRNPDFELLEEKEALLAAIATNENMAWAVDAIADTLGNEMILYHIASKGIPGLVLLQTETTLQRMAEYVNRFL